MLADTGTNGVNVAPLTRLVLKITLVTTSAGGAFTVKLKVLVAVCGGDA